MTGADADFETFVAARFVELCAVCATTTGDPRHAAEVTADALAALRPRWAELTTTGSPTSASRTAVLTAALTASARGGGPDAAAAGAETDGSDPSAPGDSSVRAALTAVVAAAPATARAALAVARWWDETPALVAACAHTGTTAVQADLDDLHRALATAHATALGRPADELAWALPAAVAETLDAAVDTASPPELLALVTARCSQAARRRRLGAAAAALLLSVAAVTAVAWPGSSSRLPGHGTGEELAAAQRLLVSAATGHPTDALNTTATLQEHLRVPHGGGPIPSTLDTVVTVVSTVTPDGYWVRTARLSGTSADSDWSFPEYLVSVPASDPAHALFPAGEEPYPTFVALGPDAATAQLVTPDGQVRDTATIRGGLALLTSPRDPPGTAFRLRLLAPDGHLVYDEVPPAPTELLP